MARRLSVQQGALIQSVAPKSAAAAAGLLPTRRYGPSAGWRMTDIQCGPCCLERLTDSWDCQQHFSVETSDVSGTVRVTITYIRGFMAHFTRQVCRSVRDTALVPGPIQS